MLMTLGAKWEDDSLKEGFSQQEKSHMLIPISNTPHLLSFLLNSAVVCVFLKLLLYLKLAIVFICFPMMALVGDYPVVFTSSITFSLYSVM